jgi:hypothetical protein
MKRHANLTEHTRRQQQEQAEKKWSTFLNATLGILGYPLGLACLTTKTPSFNALLALLFLLTLWFTGRRYVPKHFLQKKKPGSSGSREGHRNLKDRSRFWLGTLPAVFGYCYLCLIALTGRIEWYCNSPVHQCAQVSVMLLQYVGAPGP